MERFNTIMTITSLDGLVVRAATINDLKTLVKIRLVFLEDSFRKLTDNEVNSISAQLNTYYEEHLGSDMVAVLACLGTEVISCAFLVIDERPVNLSFPTGRIGTILNVYTKPEWRSNGLASKVLNRLLAIAQEQKISRIGLKATKLGLPLYQKFGFQKIGDEHIHMELSL